MQNDTVWRQFGSFLQTESILKYDREITPQSFYPNELKNHINRENLHTSFIATSMISAKTWKQARYPSTGEEINSHISIQWNITHQ